MKTRFAAIAVLAVFVVLTSTAAVMFVSDSDADVVTTEYYYNQLTQEQKNIYDKLKVVDSNPVLEGDKYVFTIDMASSSEHADVQRAFDALKLDDPFAVVTWTKGSLLPDLSCINDDITPYYAIKIAVDSSFEWAIALRDDAKAIINSMDVSGESVTDKIKSINSTLTGKDYQFKEDGANGVYGLIGDKPRELSAAGFSAVVKALCIKSGVDLTCMQVYGTLADGSKNKVHAWNEIIVDDGEVYGLDVAINNKTGDDAWLLAGRYTTYDGDIFAKVHLAFQFNVTTGLEYDLKSELLCNDGYEWPENSSIMDTLKENAHWILIGLICVVLAIYLFVTARKGGIQ